MDTNILGYLMAIGEHYIYDDVCRELGCSEYIEWEFEYGECKSCQKVGQSYAVDEFPEDCLHLEVLKAHKEKIDKELSWRLLHDV